MSTSIRISPKYNVVGRTVAVTKKRLNHFSEFISFKEKAERTNINKTSDGKTNLVVSHFIPPNLKMKETGKSNTNEVKTKNENLLIEFPKKISLN